jgi:amino acid transporter
MAVLPFERYQLTTQLTPAQIAVKLEDWVDEMDEYAAVLIGETLSISPLVGFRLGGYSQSFKPTARIPIKPSPADTVLSIVLEPKAGALFTLGLIVIILLAGIGYSQRSNLAFGYYKDAAIAAIGVLILAYLLPVTAFNTESEKLKLFIEDLLEIKQTN